MDFVMTKLADGELDDAVFWERLRDMPDTEAEIELVMRRHVLTDENAALLAFRAGRYGQDAEEAGIRMARNNATLTRIGDEIKIVRNRMDRANWRKAVRTVLGEDAYLRCAVWIAQNCVEPGHVAERLGKER